MQTYGRSSLCVRMCNVKQYEIRNVLPQISHACGFSPVCTRSCFTFSCGRANSLGQYWHGYGNRTFRISAFVCICEKYFVKLLSLFVFISELTTLGSLCAFRCINKSFSLANCLLHAEHKNDSAPLCDNMCTSSKVPPNVLLHILQKNWSADEELRPCFNCSWSTVNILTGLCIRVCNLRADRQHLNKYVSILNFYLHYNLYFRLLLLWNVVLHVVQTCTTSAADDDAVEAAAATSFFVRFGCGILCSFRTCAASAVAVVNFLPQSLQ